MTKLYTDADLWDAYAQRRRYVWIFIAVALCYVGAIIGCIMYYITLPFYDKMLTWTIVIIAGLTALFYAFAFPFIDICCRRCHAYCKALKYFSRGLKESATLPFREVDDWTTHDGVDVNVAVFTKWNKKHDEFMKTQVYIDGEKDFPAFEEGDVVRYVTQGNLLLEYEILKNNTNEEEIV